MTRLLFYIKHPLQTFTYMFLINNSLNYDIQKVTEIINFQKKYIFSKTQLIYSLTNISIKYWLTHAKPTWKYKHT